MVVLSCSHCLCTECYKKWVSRRLNCPFCREDFHRRTVNKNQWEVLEWQVKDAIGDIYDLEAKLGKAWESIEFSSTNDELIVAYAQMMRTIGLQEDDDGTIIFNKKEF